jgi:hypothetical protein
MENGKSDSETKDGLLLESEISLTRFASLICSFFTFSFFFFFHTLFFVHLPFSGSGVLVGFFFFFDSDVSGSSASRTVPPQKPRSHFLFVSDEVDASCVASFLPQTWRIHEQHHAQHRRLQLRRFLQPHLFAELNNPIELPDRRESVRPPSCRSHANEELREAARCCSSSLPFLALVSSSALVSLCGWEIGNEAASLFCLGECSPAKKPFLVRSFPLLNCCSF